MVLVLGATVALVRTAQVEEQENIAYFGHQYARYMLHTKRFVPGIW
jgi:protein-S-isoprenylcysteine O-methyltransferase Ste14